MQITPSCSELKKRGGARCICLKEEQLPSSPHFKKLIKRYLQMFFKESLPKRDFHNGLVGCGHFVRCAYIPTLNKPDNPIVSSGLYSRSIQSSENVSRMLRYKTKVFSSYEELVNSGIKAVIITAPNHLHYHYIAESLKRNLDVFCEKPIANSLEDALRIKSLVQNSRNVLMIGFNRRYLDRIRKLKSIVEDGAIGKVKEVHAFHRQNAGDNLLKSDWMSDKNKSGGGVLHNAGIHLVNMMLYIFGRIDRVSSEFQNIKMPISCGEDTASCRFIFKSGVCGFLKASSVSDVDFAHEGITIMGDKGVITSDVLGNNIIAIKDNSNSINTIYCNKEFIPDSVYNELAHFYNCVKHRKAPDTDIDDSIETMKVIKAAYISAIEKKEVCVDEIGKT